MACTRERAALIGELAAGRLDAADSAELLEHVERCAACSEELDLVADLVAASTRPHGELRTFARRRTAVRIVLAASAAAAAVLVLVLAQRGGTARRVADLARLVPPPMAGLVPRGGGTDEDPRDEALRLFAAGDHAGAAEGLARVVESSPDDPLALFYLGVARLQRAPDEAAIGALERAAELGEGHLGERALWYLVQARLARGEAGAAQEGLRRLIALDGEYEPNARALLEDLERIAGR